MFAQYRSIVAAFAVGTILAGCGTPGNATSGVLHSAQIARPAVQSRGKAAKLFVANGASVTVYDAQTGAYQRAIDNGGRTVRTLVTNNGSAIVGSPQGSVVTIYGGPKLRKLQKLHLPHPIAMATDAAGNLFILSAFKGKRVEVFAPGLSLPYNPTPVRTIGTGINNALTITVDAAGNLYVPNWGEGRGKNVTVYAPGGTTPVRTITQDIRGPHSAALDAAGDLYVTNQGPGTDEHGYVTVYAAGTTTLTNTITYGIAYPQSLAFDGSGNLFVANIGLPGEGDSVTEYAAGSLNLTRTITSGIDQPGGIALDSSGDLYVPNFYSNSVTVYSPNSDVPTQTISRSVSYPTDVSIER